MNKPIRAIIKTKNSLREKDIIKDIIIADTKDRLKRNDYISGVAVKFLLADHPNHGINIRTLGVIYNPKRLTLFNADEIYMYGKCSKQTYENITQAYRTLQELVK